MNPAQALAYNAADAQCIREFQAAVRKLDAEGLPKTPRGLTLFAQQLAMSLGVEKTDPTLLQHLARRLFEHKALVGHHKMLWRRMVNMITPSCRAECKLELRGYGWDLANARSKFAKDL